MIEPSWSSAVSISSPPPTVNELLAASSSSPSSPSLNHEDSSRAFLIPASFQSSQLTIRPDSSLEELLKVLEKCKELVLNCEQCSPERSWLVRYLVEMRYRIHELQDCENSPTELGYTISGHHFKFQNQSYANRKLYCDHCSGIIRNVIQGSYICQDCEFVCHRKCVAQVVRVCPHVVASEGRLLTVICPQKGLALQGYRCAECKEDLIFKGRLNEARLCDYSGQFYCATCHWNNSIEIPARIVHNWDFEKRPVSQFAYQLLQLTKTRPLINLEEVNNKLFNFVAELDFVRKVRGDLKLIGRYLVSCQEGRSLVSGDILHMIETTNLYSVENLIEAQNGQLSSHLSKILENFRVHIIDCPVCYGKGYSCELCGNDDVIFPFDSGSIACKKCNSLFHIVCWTKKQKVCPKCRRIKLRNADTSSLSEEAEVDEDFILILWEVVGTYKIQARY